MSRTLTGFLQTDLANQRDDPVFAYPPGGDGASRTRQPVTASRLQREGLAHAQRLREFQWRRATESNRHDFSRTGVQSRLRAMRSALLEEGRGVGPLRPVSEPTRVRDERTCPCANPSMMPVSRVALESAAYETAVFLLDETGGTPWPVLGCATPSRAVSHLAPLARPHGEDWSLLPDLHRDLTDTGRRSCC